ncbi:NAD(P)H-dependent oxidoreductase [Dokdonia sp.]|uniref:flavodoxin family protein n=1 Tax=Dokdonia sp. TaxID=2024995 RepID=UPI003267E399
MKDTVIILGSSRSDGDTAKAVFKMQDITGCDYIDLNDYDISYYDYEHENKIDDFLPLMKRVIQDYQNIIVATPVYWYTMSGILKVFFDRVSDLLTIEKDLGRQLRGKGFGVISCCINSGVDKEFWHPFEKTSGYLGMPYLGNVHINSLENDALFTGFIKEIEAKE